MSTLDSSNRPKYPRGVFPYNEVRWFTANPCYIYHVVNSWEQGDEIIMDVCRVKNPSHMPRAKTPLAAMLAYLRLDAHIYRYRFNLHTGQTTEGPLDESNIEFPSVDSRIVGRPHRYSYNMRLSNDDTLLFDALVRFDSSSGEQVTHSFGSGRWGSEAPFAPRDGSASEVDGYLVSFITNEREGRSEVGVFDAADVAAGPVARVLLPQRVPIGFHATWVRMDQLRA